MPGPRHTHTVDPVYAPPVLRAPSPTDSISTEYGLDETSIADKALSDEDFAKRVDLEIGLRKTKWSEVGVPKSVLLGRTPDSKEEASKWQAIV